MDKKKWKCNKGHELKPFPNTKCGYYCPECEPTVHDYVSVSWRDRNKKRMATIRKNRTTKVLNEIYEIEISK